MGKFTIIILIVANALASQIVFAADNRPVVLNLESSIQLALETSPQIGSANASAAISKAKIGRARSALYPNLGIESGYSYITKPTFFGETPVLDTDTVTNRLVARQIVYSGGGTQANVSHARLGYLAARHGAQAARADVLTNVGTAYFRARQAKETIDVANASMQSLAASYDAAEKLHESGIVTKSDVLRAQVALTSAKADLIAATNNYNIAIAALRTAIGLPQSTDIDLAVDSTDNAADAALSAVPGERPEIAAASASVLAADAGKKAAKAGKLPAVSLVADYFNQPVGAQFPRLTNTVMAGVMVTFNIFDGGLTSAAISEADAAAKKSRQDLENEKRRVELEQQAANLDLDSANARVETTANQVQSAEESLRSLQVGYKEGITPLTDVLSAQTALTNVTVSRLAALYDVKIAQINLLRAYGLTDVLANQMRNSK